MFKEYWRRYRRRRFFKLLLEHMQPIWLFDRGGYYWFTSNRRLWIKQDQVGNWMVFDDVRMLSGHLKSVDECKKFAINMIVDEIINTYYPKLLKK